MKSGITFLFFQISGKVEERNDMLNIVIKLTVIFKAESLLFSFFSFWKTRDSSVSSNSNSNSNSKLIGNGLDVDSVGLYLFLILFESFDAIYSCKIIVHYYRFDCSSLVERSSKIIHEGVVLGLLHAAISFNFFQRLAGLFLFKGILIIIFGIYTRCQ